MAEAVEVAQVDLPMTTTPPPPVTDGGAPALVVAPSLSASPDPGLPAPPQLPASPPTVAAAAKNKSAYRPQKAATVAAVAEHILEAVAATKERQAATPTAARRKTISAADYEVDGARPRHPSAGKKSSARGGKPEEAARGETQKKAAVANRKRAPKKASSAARGSHQSFKAPKALKRSSSKPRKALKRPVGRKRVAGKRR